MKPEGHTGGAMTMDIQKLENMLARGQDNALLRYALGNAYYQAGQRQDALPHLAKAVELDPNYSAAWKTYGKVLAELERHEEAIAAYGSGIEAAERRGDMQAAKEMRVFKRRLEKML
jgi:tetratricopeptide (TPR) repeat protein